jgi:formiminoglutamase
MLQNWLKPSGKNLHQLRTKLPPQALGHQLIVYEHDFPVLKNVKVALIGTHDSSADAARTVLYQYIGAFPGQSVADLGNLRKTDQHQLIPVLYELMTGGILPIVISPDHNFAAAQFFAYQEAKALVNWAMIDEQLRHETVLGQVFEPVRHPLLFHAALIGAQQHLLHHDESKWLEKNKFELLRLGRSRTDLEETEPVIRDADLLTFHLNALKMCDLPGVERPSPSGYFLEEACQLARYAGMSDKLTSAGFYGLHQPDGQSEQALAQLIWYFLDGFFNRKGDYPVSQKGLTEYVVELPTYNYQLIFWKSTRSGRWWLQVPNDTKRKHQRHRLIPCSYQDYQMACRQELPDRIIQAFKRF